MELAVFGRFHAREGKEDELAALLRDQVGPVRAEAGCLSIDTFRSTRDRRLFYLHSRWVDDAAFDLHATLSQTLRFLERVRPLIDHPLDVTRTTRLG